MTEKNQEVYDIITQTKNSFEIFSDGLLNEYQNTFIGKLLHCEFITEQMNNILSSVSDELIDTTINEKINSFNDKLKELTEKNVEEKIKIIESIDDIKSNLTNFTQKINKELDESIFTKENELLSSFNLIKEYISKYICTKINSYADNIKFYIDHNLQSIESSSKTNEALLEMKIEQLNKKENEIIDMKVKNEKLNLDLSTKEAEYKLNLQIEIDKYNELKNKHTQLIEEKEKLIKYWKDKYDERNKELSNSYNSKNVNKDENQKLKEENIELKLKLGLKEKELKTINEKIFQN